MTSPTASGPAQTAGRTVVRSLSFWNNTPNFGDVLSRDVVAWALGMELPRARAGDSDVLLAIGSIVHRANDFASSVIWGSGVEPAYGEAAPRNTRILAVRGPKSAEALGVSGVPFGDPGVLLPCFYTPAKPKAADVGLVPHHRSMAGRKGRAVRALLGRGTRVIDPRRDWRPVVDDIASCRFVFCESLHGAIVAQAYGVPWAWWKGVHGHRAEFKWADWFASLGAEPRGFMTTRLAAAERWASQTRRTTPSADDLVAALRDNVDARPGA